ncbi:MAG TPA: hypothetical protein VJN96_00280 [Vicinamibacterales bacterium]|nr:hypothetical protein [Vicinamibacterales bacterium]
MAMVLLAALVQTPQTVPILPTLTPFFMSREVEGGPAFLIECRNTTSAGISSGSEIWALARSAIRIDGTVLDEQGRIGPGLTMDIPPGGTWRGIIELRQTAAGTSYATAFGANVRMPTVVALNAGRHAIAVRCAGLWSTDLPFYWEK